MMDFCGFDILGLVAAAGEINDPVTVIGGVLATALTTLTGIQTSQMAGLRADFHAYRALQDERVKVLEGAVNTLTGQMQQLAEDSGAPPRPRKRAGATGSQSRTRGRRG